MQSLGISLRSATEPIDDTSTGKLMEGVLAAFAQFDDDVALRSHAAGEDPALELGGGHSVERCRQSKWRFAKARPEPDFR